MGDAEKFLDRMLPKPAPVRLHPPPEPIMMTEEPSDDFFIEFATCTEFKRFVYKLLYGRVHRTEKQHGNLDQKVKQGLELIRELQAENPNYGDVINEFKGLLRKREERLNSK